MLRDGSVDVDEIEDGDGSWAGEGKRIDWREVDRALRRIAKRRAALDAEEARWLREAARVQIWREVACVSLLDYLEQRCGYAPRTARDRVRVAFALEELPGLTAALAAGEHSFSSIKELVRVATPEHEDEWLEQCRDRTCFEIQKLVSGRAKGSRPTDAPEPDLETRPLHFEDIKPSTIALLRQARAKGQEDRGERLSDDALIAMLCGAFLESGTTSEASGRAKYQIAVTVCEKCNQGWQDGAGAKLAIDATELARAECDAQRIGSLDAEWPTRATQDIPPSVRRLVWRRDGGKCTLASCRSAANLELHHIIARSDGGTHEPSQIVLLCDSHHTALHQGRIAITGRAPDKLVVTGVNESPAHVGHSKLDQATMLVEARMALVTLGYKKHEAASAVDAAHTHAGTGATLEVVIREALRRCRKPGGQ